MARPCRFLVPFVVAASLAVTAHARAYVDAHATSDDVRIAVDASGTAMVEHRIGYRVAGGVFRGFDLAGLERGAVVEPEVTVSSDDARGEPRAAFAEAVGETGLHVTIEDAKGLRRGTYVFSVRYKVDLVAANEIVRDGGMWRIAWTSPIAHDGLDGARVVFRVPPAPTEPRAVSREAGGGDDGTISTLRRSLDHDELDLVRPHVARGEAAAWSVRVDPKAFPAVRDPRLRPPPPAAAVSPRHSPEMLGLAALAVAAALFALLARAKAQIVDRACAAAGVTPRPVVPLSSGVRATAAGALFAAGVWTQANEAPTAGAALVAGAMALVAFRPPHAKVRARGPGRWLALRPEEVWSATPTPGAWLDIGTRAGQRAATAAAALALLVAWGAAHVDARAALLVILDALALVPLFATGRTAQLPPTPLAAAPALRAVWERLRGTPALRATPWARVPMGEIAADELRVLAMPRASMPGLLGIEVGLAWARTSGGYVPLREVLVRVTDGSQAASRVAAMAPTARAIPGRRSDERVYALAPRWPSAGAAARLVSRLASELTDRRVAPAAAAEVAWQGDERRTARVAEATLAA